MHFRCKWIFTSFNFFLFIISAVFLCSDSEDLLTENEILFKLRPTKYAGSKSCRELCQSVDCQAIKDCADGVLLKDSYCNCCNICVKYSDTNSPCKDLIHGSLALGGQSRCKPGTKCEKGKCILDRSVKGCLTQRQNRNDNMGKGNYSDDIWIPHCDKEGKYEGKQRKIKKSICVDEIGNRIFGSPDDSFETGCACSCHMQTKKGDISYNAKPHEHCSSKGDYDTLQCIGNLCYCADPKTGQVRSHLVKMEFLDKLPCYDRKIHRKGYMKSCKIELLRTRKLMYEFGLKGVKLTGIDRIKCDPDGSFSPVQCLSDRCICVNKEGVGIGSYGIEKKDDDKINMTCNCARDEMAALFPTSFTCLGYGNYHPVTCFGTDDCVCVDEDGDSVSKEFKKSEIDVKFCVEMAQKLSEEPEKEKDDDKDDNAYTEDDYDYTDEDYYYVESASN